MNGKLRNAIFIFWAIFFILALLLYFFNPALFYQMIEYPGSGGPFVKTPRG